VAVFGLHGSGFAQGRFILDGVKRDRHGWFGDARITKETIDLTFSTPLQAKRC
jgi:hypothetical protein